MHFRSSREAMTGNASAVRRLGQQRQQKVFLTAVFLSYLKVWMSRPLLTSVLNRLSRRGAGWYFLKWSIRRGTFFRLVKVYERKGQGNLSFWPIKGPKGLRDTFYGCEKVKKMFWFCDLFILYRQCIYSS